MRSATVVIIVLALALFAAIFYLICRLLSSTLP